MGNGITDLAQVAERRQPVRILGGTGDLFQPILGHYGLTLERIESWGGRFLPTLATTPGPRYVVTPEAAAFVDASILFNLRIGVTAAATCQAQ